MKTRRSMRCGAWIALILLLDAGWWCFIWSSSRYGGLSSLLIKTVDRTNDTLVLLTNIADDDTNENIRKLDTQKEVRDDGCGLHSRPSQVQWTNSTAHYDATQQPYLQQVQTCAKQFLFSYIDTPPELMRWLYCDLPVTHDNILSVIKRHSDIVFVGDSVLRQQYYVFLCMINPMLNVTTDMTYNTQSQVDRILYVHEHYDGDSDEQRGGFANTTLLYEPWGFVKIWRSTQKNLYEDAFPQAIRTLTRHDAIVMDASRHFDTTRIPLYVNALHFIAQQAAHSNASVYFMEPTPEEWPTRNGFFSPPCRDKVRCRCEPLTADRLRGNMTDYPNYIHQAVLQSLENLTAAATTDNSTGSIATANLTQETSTTMLAPILHSAQVFHSFHVDHNFSSLAENAENFTLHNQRKPSRTANVCVSNCLPATWRADVAHAVLSLAPSANSKPSLPVSTVHMVPTFLQLVSRPPDMHSSRSQVNDCTHRSFDAIVTMNEQLIRTMLRMN